MALGWKANIVAGRRADKTTTTSVEDTTGKAVDETTGWTAVKYNRQDSRPDNVGKICT